MLMERLIHRKEQHSGGSRSVAAERLNSIAQMAFAWRFLVSVALFLS